MKKLIITAMVAGSALFTGAASVYAQSNCVTQYGGGVVCGATTPIEKVHKPTETAIGDINPAVLSSLFIGASYIVYKFGKRFERI